MREAIVLFPVTGARFRSFSECGGWNHDEVSGVAPLCAGQSDCAGGLNGQRIVQCPPRAPRASALNPNDCSALPRGSGPCLPCYWRQLRLAEASRQRSSWGATSPVVRRCCRVLELEPSARAAAAGSRCRHNRVNCHACRLRQGEKL